MSDKKQVKLIMEVNKEDCDVVTTVTEKIVSTALGYTPMDAALKGANLGVSELDANGKVVASQLPSYVDDVIEGYLYNGSFYKESAHTTKITGESGKIYIDLSTGKTYRWSGSIYTVISETLALGETSSTAYRGDRGKIAYEHSQTAHAPSNAEKNQNAFANVKVGDTTIVADNTSDTLTLTAGDNITITPNVGSDTIAISATVATYGAAGSSLGLVKSGGDVTISSGVITVKDDSHNHVISNIDGLQNELNGKASTSVATTSANGLMTSAMVTKLNGITSSADSVSFSRSLSSGTKVGTITINGTGTDLYAPSNTWRGIQNNLTSTSTTDSLSAAQGKALNDKIDGLKYASSPTVGGAAYHAMKLVSKDNEYEPTTWGSATCPVYISEGIPSQCSYSLNKTVPSDADFNDTKNTAGTSNSTAQLYIVGAPSQAESFVTYSNSKCYIANSQLYSNGTVVSVAGHTHSYAGASSSGGAATSANKLNTNAGSSTQPVYFSNGVPVSTTYSLGKSVPSDAIFTDQYVQQTISGSSTVDLPIMCGSSNMTSGKADVAFKNSNFKISSKTGVLTAPYFKSSNGGTLIYSATSTSYSGGITITIGDSLQYYQNMIFEMEVSCQAGFGSIIPLLISIPVQYLCASPGTNFVRIQPMISECATSQGSVTAIKSLNNYLKLTVSSDKKSFLITDPTSDGNLIHGMDINIYTI